MTSRRARRVAGSDADRGSAGLLAVWAAVVVVAVTTTAAAWGAVVVARHRAGRAADAAALAGAAAVVRLAADPCGSAARVATAAGAVLEVCRVLADRSVLVVVAVRTPPGGTVAGLDVPPARARARAGAPP